MSFERSELDINFFSLAVVLSKEPRALSKLFGLSVLLENQNVATE